MYDSSDFKKTYQNLSNGELVDFARHKSKNLRKEAVLVLKQEIESRGLDSGLVKWVDTESNKFEGAERSSLINRIRNLRCPRCDSAKDKLFGFEINYIYSYLISCNHVRKEKILCRSCGSIEKLKAIATTFFTGWWSEEGFFITFVTLSKDTVNFLFTSKISDGVFDRFVTKNTGFLRRRGTEIKTLENLILKQNRIETPDENDL
ncbi:MAG: hypothetical protein EOO50_14095 [Flavobacterium sp.]|uniref:hypothetical protein n=1 Tax=Flavobacterium sp. TaxID=239 RepID=UPI00121D2A0E|nr:hypothetical protein [Flavobacterium sp.]RZJ65380.1 MAG: hypothetical protein EOO50_14095 [Flavobacterium sp.]